VTKPANSTKVNAIKNNVIIVVMVFKLLSLFTMLLILIKATKMNTREEALKKSNAVIAITFG